MSLPTLSYAKTSSLHLPASSSSSFSSSNPSSAMPVSSFSLPSAWHAMVDHGSGKRKAADNEYQVALDWLQGEIDRIAKRHKLSVHTLTRTCYCPLFPCKTSDVQLTSWCAPCRCIGMLRMSSDCVVDVRACSNKRVKVDTSSNQSVDESKAERRQRIETAQQEAIAQQQQQLLATTPDEPTPPLGQHTPPTVQMEEPTGQENVPPPTGTVKGGKGGKGKSKAARKG